MSLRWIIDIFTDTAAILNLLDLRSITECPGGTRLVFKRAFRAKRAMGIPQYSLNLINSIWSIVLKYTYEVISVESGRKPLKKRLVWLTGEFMREHVAVNSRCAKVRSLQQLQTWQITVLTFCKLYYQWFKRKGRTFKFLFLLRRNAELYFLPSTQRDWESSFCRFLQMLSTAPMIKTSVVYLKCSLPR